MTETKKPWPGYCQSCQAKLTPPNRTDCPSCGKSDELSSLHKVEEALEHCVDFYCTTGRIGESACGDCIICNGLKAVRAYPDDLKEAAGLLKRFLTWQDCGCEFSPDGHEQSNCPYPDTDAFLERMKRDD